MDYNQIYSLISSDFIIDEKYLLKAIAYYNIKSELNGGFNPAKEVDLSIYNVNGVNIADLKFDGVMIQEGGICNVGISDLAEVIHVLNSSASVDGLFFRLNTGGGEVTAGQTLYNALYDFKKPITVYTNLLASGGIMGSLPAFKSARSKYNEVVASGNMASIGSIGVKISLDKRILSEIDANTLTVYSTKSTRKDHEIRELLKGNIEPLIKAADEIDDEFIKMVNNHINIEDKYKARVFSGEVFKASKAKEMGLVNYIGTRDMALRRLVANIKESKKN